LCAFAQHRSSKIEAVPHGGFHYVAMRLVIGMDFRHELLSSIATPAY